MRKVHAFLVSGLCLLAGAACAQAPAAPRIDSGDTAWMLTSTLLVILMTIPGLALFYGGLGRAKNMLSVLVQVFVIFALVSVLWALYGYSLAFSGEGNFFGGLDKLFLKGVTPETFGAFLKAGAIAAAAGSALVDQKMLKERNWAAITARAAQFVEAVKTAGVK